VERHRIHVAIHIQVARVATDVTDFEDQPPWQLALNCEVNYVVTRDFEERVNRERERLAIGLVRHDGRSNCLRRGRQWDRAVNPNAIRLSDRMLRRGYVDSLGETYAERRDNDRLHRIGAIVDQRVAAANYGLALSEESAEQAALERRIPRHRKTRREVLVVRVVCRAAPGIL